MCCTAILCVQASQQFGNLVNTGYLEDEIMHHGFTVDLNQKLAFHDIKIHSKYSSLVLMINGTSVKAPSEVVQLLVTVKIDACSCMDPTIDIIVEEGVDSGFFPGFGPY
ncbi:unnamed protein product [Albugo candida]|uniref:Uncharacterized protein n=1 Tax=Albugo candida TaxID=65357 RepID=A0A024GNA4_9STRA|nr:unnamed protein product [Albugo candida]|eukprot:CCI47990.1 unnamed protein product [Albugo candida]